MDTILPSAAASGPASGCRLDPRVALKTIIGFWAFYFVLNTLRMAISFDLPDQMDMMKRRLVVVLLGIALTYLLYSILRRLEGKPLRVMVTAAFLTAIPICIAYATINYTAFYVVSPSAHSLEELRKEAESTPANSHKSVSAALIADYAISWYFFIVAWAVLYIALTYSDKMRQAERDAALYRAKAQEAHLRALRYQINPHFLFNTLNSLSTLVLKGRTQEAERMIMNLSTFFRTSLACDPTDDVPLADEVRMQRLYLDIEQVRFPERLSTAFDVPDDLAKVRVPSMILQPVVENAIKHGVARSCEPVTIKVSARRANGGLSLAVEDDANPSGDAAERGEGVGLNNVCDRLAARYNGGAACTYGPKPEGGFKVELRMPLQQ
jgi:LytS/YehU family sensor histidine kinase